MCHTYLWFISLQDITTHHNVGSQLLLWDLDNILNYLSLLISIWCILGLTNKKGKQSFDSYSTQNAVKCRDICISSKKKAIFTATNNKIQFSHQAHSTRHILLLYIIYLYLLYYNFANNFPKRFLSHYRKIVIILIYFCLSKDFIWRSNDKRWYWIWKF